MLLMQTGLTSTVAAMQSLKMQCESARDEFQIDVWMAWLTQCCAKFRIDSNDDHLCVKSGADWLGRQAAVPSENITFENCEIRSGHGMTLGSEMSGGIRNVTYRNIFYNAAASSTNADPRDPGPPKKGFYPGGAHFKTQRGRGDQLTQRAIFP